VDNKTGGILEVGTLDGEVVVNHPDLQPDANGVGHIVFSPDQARNLGYLLIRKAEEAEQEARQKYWKERELKPRPVD